MVHALPLLLLACAPTPAAPPVAAPAPHPALTPHSPPPLGLHLGSLATSGGSGADTVLDGDLRTGWRPPAGPGALLTLRFAEPVTADTLTLTPCPASAPVALGIVANGSTIAVLPASADPVSVPLGVGQGGGRVARLDLRIRSGEPGVCLGEIALSEAGRALPLRPPRAVTATVRASSVLPPAELHHPDLLFDHRLEHGWTEGKPGDGVGESVTLNFREAFGLVGLDVGNGDHAAGTGFGEAPRVRTLGVGVDNGGRIALAVRDEPDAQRIDLPRMLVGHTFTFSVTATEPGAHPTGLSVAELGLRDLYGPVGVVVDGLAARSADMLGSVRRTALEPDLDVPLTSLCATGRSVTLRSNLAFEAEFPGTEAAGDLSATVPQPVVAEGDWTFAKRDGAWFVLTLAGGERAAGTGWIEPEAQAAEDPLASAGVLRLAPVAELSRAAFNKDVAGLGAVKGCLQATGTESGMDPFDLLVKRDAVVVEGTFGTDLLTR